MPDLLAKSRDWLRDFGPAEIVSFIVWSLLYFLLTALFVFSFYALLSLLIRPPLNFLQAFTAISAVVAVLATLVIAKTAWPTFRLAMIRLALLRDETALLKRNPRATAFLEDTRLLYLSNKTSKLCGAFPADDPGLLSFLKDYENLLLDESTGDHARDVSNIENLLQKAQNGLIQNQAQR